MWTHNLDPVILFIGPLEIRWYGLFYVIGFSAVFVLLGTLFGLVGSALVEYQIWLRRIGGVFIILFGLFMLNILRLPFLNFLQGEHQPKFLKVLKPGSPISSFTFGSAFAVGWTPCVGPVLGAILTLAATTTTVWQGAFLLSVFSLGLAVPFLVVAATIGSASNYLSKIGKVLNWVTIIGGMFLIVLGYLLLTDQFAKWLSFAYQFFSFINYDALLDYL